MERECCWGKGELLPDECPCVPAGEEELYVTPDRRFLEKCLECPRFKHDVERLQEEGNPLALLVPQLMEELLDQKVRLLSMGSFLHSKTREIRFLHELNVVLQTSLDLDEILSIAMTAITAGKGFGMNRAFLLMTDKERQHLNGYLGVGPRNYDDANHIWQEIGQHDMTLREMARNFQRTKLASEKMKFNDILQKLSVPLSHHDHIFSRVLQDRKPVLIRDAFNNPEVDPELARLLGVDSFLIMPLISRNRRVGLLLADNCITRKPISHQDMQLIETFAFPVAFALERASLYERLQEQVDKLVTANAKLKEQQELIVKMEKMALVGQITSSIAHSIRNPLMIIGGFARSLLKTVSDNDRNREYLESIVREAKQLEDVLEEVLNYAESLYPAMDRWDINQLVSSVFEKSRNLLSEKGITFRLDLEAGLPMALIDYKQLAFCVTTVLNNTVEKSCRVSMVRGSTRLHDEFITIEIWDEGTEQNVSGFSQSTFSEVGENLRLPLCKTILEKNGTRFVIERSDAGSTRYVISVPLSGP